MTLKEFAKKYDFEYYLVYLAMREKGNIVHHMQNVDYEEQKIIDATILYFTMRKNKYLAKAQGFEDMMTKLREGIS